MKTRYIISNIVIHVIFLLIIIFLYDKSPLLFVISELLLLFSLYFSIQTAIKLFRPYKLLEAGISSMKDKDFSVKFKMVGQPELDNLMKVYNKMIDQLRLERTRQFEKHFFLEKLIDASPSGVIIFDLSRKVETINDVAKNILANDYLASSEIVGVWKKHIDMLETEETATVRINSIKQYRCQKSHFLDRGAKIPFVIIAEFTEEIIKTEKRAYGKVIRMMAHEVNNTLGAVNSIIDSSVFHFKQADNDEHTDFTDALSIASERNDNLSIFMKSFADIVRLPLPVKHNIDIHEALLRSLLFIQNSCTKIGVEFINKMNTNQFYVSADSEQMEQVFLNIIKNAVEAINEKGSVIIETFPEKKEISIRNTGEPITFEGSQRLFEAFFTTKKTGKGIGLTLIKEILTNHNCEFSLQTRKDKITEFSIVFIS